MNPIWRVSKTAMEDDAGWLASLSLSSSLLHRLLFSQFYVIYPVYWALFLCFVRSIRWFVVRFRRHRCQTEGDADSNASYSEKFRTSLDYSRVLCCEWKLLDDFESMRLSVIVWAWNGRYRNGYNESSGLRSVLVLFLGIWMGLFMSTKRWF